MKKIFGAWEITRFTRGFIVFAVMLSVLLQNAPSLYAAVPVYMVNPRSDPGNVFVVNFDESSIETFMFDLFNTLAKRDEDFTTSFELMKIEKAREDVNKLFQESLKELQDYGAVLGSINEDWTTKSSTGPGASNDYELSALKGSRIITDPYDYLFNEPLAAGRITGICYYLSVIADQRGWLFSNSPVKATFSNRYNETPPLQTDPFNADTNESVNRIWDSLTTFLLVNNPGPNKINEFLDNESIFLNKPAFDNRTTGKTELLRRIFYCDGILASFGIDSPYLTDSLIGVYKLNGLSLDSKQEEQFRQKVLGLPTLINNGPTYEQARLAREGINNIGGVGTTASTAAAGVVQRTAKIHELSFIAGQGVRPQNLYVTYQEQNRASVRSGAGGGPNLPKESAFLLNTERVISPAVLLLQKMQASTQAEFDLAGQGYLALDPNLKSNPFTSSILTSYNVDSNAPAFGAPSEDPETSPRGVCNNPAGTNSDGTPLDPLCFLLDPWLNPTPSFKTATLDPNSILPRQPISGGLPAPFEDENSYVRLGTNYNVGQFRNSSSFLNNRGDNIENKLTGIDYSINDWFDRVLEMYEPSRGDDWFTLQDWDCYIATWFAALRIDVPLGGTPWSPDPFSSLSVSTQCAHRIPTLSGGTGDGSY
ncbi:MAG: hypothetical protein A3A97_04365 [Candidatus Terrybacteria bacterium RIFCSPLOWO2_01_FULL_40_23]|uniref:Uncharacterized protein n=1 Tax=Candidatus Terrybacteria bacterium RIFCSPLOWO2_01_FULL_40_23 TaxID=1802366 RepID=A0A1G2PV12_9BACT|nr:MAG: hypothetical protein A3A97_04365 [Candidatus Terrybacteria bacterium RIFCSPLOWO2_01_FULL_40_23]